MCTVKKTPDDGQRKCPKHVDYYSKNKFVKLLHLFGFIIRIYHDVESPELQIRKFHSYRTIDITRLGCKNQSVNSVWGDNLCSKNECTKHVSEFSDQIVGTSSLVVNEVSNKP